MTTSNDTTTTDDNDDVYKYRATPQELAWAKATRRAAVADPEVNESFLTDLEYFQHAVVSKGDTVKALQRIKRMQAFKEQYGIKVNGSYDEALRDGVAADAQLPGFSLSMGELPDGTAVVCFHYAAFQARKIARQSVEGRNIAMRGAFYGMQGFSCSLPAIRAGAVFLSEWQGAGWQNFSLLMEERMAQLYSHAYPVRVQQMAILNANLFIRVGVKLMDMFISRKVRQVQVLAESRRAFLEAHPQYTPDVLPEAWGGTVRVQNVMDQFKQRIQKRYDLEAKFRLDDDDDDDLDDTTEDQEDDGESNF